MPSTRSASAPATAGVTPAACTRPTANHQHPERMLIPELADYPAHLHIRLLPEFQGQGWGRQLATAS